VLLELFTSEGCSSCPPADRLLEALDRQPIANADLIVLSEHVDYWNYLGWSDPYSSAFFSNRQKQYVDHIGSTVYTPQMVIDGQFQALASDQREVTEAVAKATAKSKLPVSVKMTGSGVVHVESGGEGAGADLYIVIAADHASTKVLRGENGGHTLTHVAVVQSFRKIGKWDGAASGGRDVTVGPQAAGTRVIAILQDPRSGKILGAAQTKI
jgi:hypothetical protein